MKTFTKITLLAAGFAATVAALPVLAAADTTTGNAASTAAPAGKHPGLRALLHRRAIRQQVAKRLGLSADQISQLKSTRASTATAIKAIRADTSLTPDQKKAKARETIQAARTQMRGVLTADQQAKLGKIRTFLRNHRAQADRAL